MYLFKKEINSDLKMELMKQADKFHYALIPPGYGEIWVYKSVEGKLELLPNQPFKTKREAIRALKIHINVLNKYLDSSEIYKGFLIFSSPQNSEDKLEQMKYIH